MKPHSKSSRRFWGWLLAGVCMVAASFMLDNRAGAALLAPKGSPLQELAWWCSKMGEGWVVITAGVFFAFVFLAVRRPQAAAGIFFVMLVSSFTGLAATILRTFTGRPRPSNLTVPDGFYGVWHDGHWIIGQHAFSAFPSGHAATAAGLAAAAWLLHRGWGAAATVFALAVIWSRLALNAHHLSDVLASTVLSIALAVWMKPVLLPSVEFQFGNLHRAWRKKK